jgi:cobalamin biosynthetic protein CobC
MSKRDHGGNLDDAIARFGGHRSDWLDLSTGINPVAYPLPQIPENAWSDLPDRAAYDQLILAARQFWKVPDDAEIIAAPGASALIAQMPALTNHKAAFIPTPTYNEHAASFGAHAKLGTGDDPLAQVHVYVHPNNPDGRLWSAKVMGGRPLTIIDESFCDTCPEHSLIHMAAEPGVVVLKSFGKFWGLAGARLGFAIGLPATFQPNSAVDGRPTPGLRELLGPWAVSGPALHIGAAALNDISWANTTRKNLQTDATRLDRLMSTSGANLIGGTTLFRLYQVDDAQALQSKLAQVHVWSRVFPYNSQWIRLGLPHPDRWRQLELALS